MSRDMRAFRTVIQIGEDVTLGWLETVMAELKEIPEAHTWYLPATRELRIIIDSESDYYNGRCPVMPHGWCHGWIVRGIIQFVQDSFSSQGYELEWETIDWIPVLGRVLRVHDDEKVDFSLRKVPLHEHA